MTDDGFRGILKSASFVGVGMIFSRAIGLLAEVVIARQLPIGEFGAAIFAYTIMLTLSGIALIGIPEGFTYHLSIFDERGDDNSALRTVISGVSILAFVLFMGILSIYAVPFVLVERFGVSRSEWRWIRLLAPLLIAYPASRISFGIMRGYDRTVPKVFSDDILNKLLAFVGLSIAIWYEQETLIFLSFFLGQYLLSGLFAGSYAIYLLNTKLTGVNKIGQLRKDARQLVSYSWPLALKNTTRRLLGNTDIILVGALLASSSVGHYRVGYVISQLGMIALVSITYLYTPRMARRFDSDNRAGMKHLYSRATKWGTLLTLPLVIPMMYFPEQIIEILFGTEYAAGAIVLAVLAVDILLRVGLGPAAATLQAINRTKADFATTGVTTIMNAGLSYLLIMKLGIFGAALGTFISALFMNTTQVFLVYRYTGIIPYSLRYIGGILIVVAMSVPLFFLVNSTVANISTPLIYIPVAPFAFGALFGTVELLIVWFGGLLSQAEKESIRHALRNNRFNLIGP